MIRTDRVHPAGSADREIRGMGPAAAKKEIRGRMAPSEWRATKGELGNPDWLVPVSRRMVFHERGRCLILQMIRVTLGMVLFRGLALQGLGTTEF